MKSNERSGVDASCRVVYKIAVPPLLPFFAERAAQTSRTMEEPADNIDDSCIRIVKLPNKALQQTVAVARSGARCLTPVV
jgi:hypothetical protein